MDILTFIDKFNQNFDKQPEPRYNTKKYFTDNVDDIGPGSSNRGKLPRLNVMPEDYYSEGTGTGVMIDPRGFKDGKLQIPTQGLDDGGRVGFENGKKVKFPQNQFTKKLNKSLKDPEYIKKLVTKINLPEYADMSFKDLFKEKVITDREMRELQKLGYKAQRQGKKFNDALAKSRADKRLELDPDRLKDKAKKLAGRNKTTVIHHGYQKELGEDLTKLIVDKTGKTLFSEAEGVLQNLDVEKQKLLNNPTKNKKRINEIQAIEDRLKKGKTIPEVTSISTRTNKPVTKTNVSLKPEQKGLYGYENVSIDKKGNLTKKLKGVDTSKTIAGLSNDPLNKIDFRNVSPKDKQKIISKIVTDLKKMGYRCPKNTGGSEDLQCYLNDVKKTREDIRSSNPEIRSKAIVKQRNALKQAQKIPQIMKSFRRGAQGALGFVGGFPGLVLEGLIELGTYDYYINKGYSDKQAAAETFFAKKLGAGDFKPGEEGSGFFDGAEKLLQEELVGNDPAKQKYFDIKNSMGQKESEFEMLNKELQALKSGARGYGGGDDFQIFDKEEEIKQAVQDYSNLENQIKPGTSLYQSYQTGLEKQQSTQAGRREELRKSSNLTGLPETQMTKDNRARDARYRRKKEMEKYRGNKNSIMDLKGKSVDDFYKEFGMDPKNKFQDIYGVGGYDLLDKIGIAGGVSKLASGGLANLTRTIPPEKGPQSQGLASFMKNGKR